MVRLATDHIDDFLPLLEGKRVGLMTNPTGVNSKLYSTIDLLKDKVNLVALFSPEHGVRGDQQAGAHIDTYIDPLTNITVYSLYGEHRHPSKELMDLVDVIIFDIQDSGSRFYTYLYSMAYMMMAVKENGKKMFIIDHPNPLGGLTVEGRYLDTTYRSFVGYFPLLERYGLTIGELALYFNHEFDIEADVEVLMMDGYERSMLFEDTNLPWVLPSPNIPTPETCFTFLSNCIFEGTNLSEGRGTTKPFSFIGSPYLKNTEVVRFMNQLNLPGVLFRTCFFTPTFSKHQGVLCHGVELIITDFHSFEALRTGYLLFDFIRSTHQEFDYIAPFRKDGPMFIDLLTGHPDLRENVLKMDELFEKMDQDELTYKEKKARYHLYD